MNRDQLESWIVLTRRIVNRNGDQIVNRDDLLAHRTDTDISIYWILDNGYWILDIEY